MPVLEHAATPEDRIARKHLSELALALNADLLENAVQLRAQRRDLDVILARERFDRLVLGYSNRNACFCGSQPVCLAYRERVDAYALAGLKHRRDRDCAGTEGAHGLGQGDGDEMNQRGAVEAFMTAHEPLPGSSGVRFGRTLGAHHRRRRRGGKGGVLMLAAKSQASAFDVDRPPRDEAFGRFIAEHPNFVDGSLRKWRGVVDDLLKLPLRIVMPGHGPLKQPRDVVEFRSLIGDFYKVVEEVYKSGGAESDVRKRLELTRWQSLGRYDDMMGDNINKVWLEVEADNF